MKLSFAFLSASAFLVVDCHTVSGDHIELARSVKDATLPKAISDHTAVLGDDNLIYVAGGCDDPNGNTWNEDWATFACGSISSSLFSFNPETSDIVTLPDMPRGRYRHAAVAINNQLWLVGGRSLEDALLEDVDVFDIASQAWTTYSLPAGYASSDLGGWGTSTHAFFAGGYDANYTALAKVYSIDAAASTADNVLVIEDNGNMSTARGDVAATVNVESGYAYVSGGFSHENDFCAPLESVERYSLPPGNAWLEVASLPTARADKAMVAWEGHTIAMGGEKAPDNVCETNVTLTPAEKSVAVDDIEVLNDDDTTWQILTTLPEHRFRFAAVVYGDAIYTFGGQMEFDALCNCLKTLDEIVVYDITEEQDEEEDHSHADGSTHDENEVPGMETNDGAVTSDEDASDAMAFQGGTLVSLFSLLVGFFWIL